MDAGVGFEEGFAQGRLWPLVDVLVISMRNEAGGLFTGFFTDRMRTHAVGDEKEMAALMPLFVVTGELNGVAVLIVASADAHIRQARVFDLVEACHPIPPDAG